MGFSKTAKSNSIIQLYKFPPTFVTIIKLRNGGGGLRINLSGFLKTYIKRTQLTSSDFPAQAFIESKRLLKLEAYNIDRQELVSAKIAINELPLSTLKVA